MITNFHTPKSTLLMMISAFCGHDLMKLAYDEAIKEEYKFYSYGDAMLIIFLIINKVNSLNLVINDEVFF